MLATIPTPLVRLSNLFPHRQVWAKCEHLALSGSFKIRGTIHLLERLGREGRTRQLVVPSMGNTALGVAVGARACDFRVVGVVPRTISRAKDEKLQALGVELLKIDGGGSDLIRTATQVAREREAYLVHPHLDRHWTDCYQAVARVILVGLPGVRSLVFPGGGGGLLMGLTEYLAQNPAPVQLVGCEAFNFPTYASYHHQRSRTIAEGLVLDDPHPAVQQRIAERGIPIHLVTEADIAGAMRML